MKNKKIVPFEKPFIIAGRKKFDLMSGDCIINNTFIITFAPNRDYPRKDYLKWHENCEWEHWEVSKTELNRLLKKYSFKVIREKFGNRIFVKYIYEK